MRKAGAASRLTTLIVVSIVAATLIAGIIARAQRDQGPIDLIVFNGKVYAENGKTFAEAVAVQGNKIVLVGSNRDIKRLRRPQTTVVDAHGGAVLPGFNDSRVHLFDASASLDAIDLTDVPTVADVVNRLKEYAELHAEAEWIVGRGWQPPSTATSVMTRELLDTASSDRPVYITSSDGRTAWANTETLTRAQITKETARAHPGAVGRNRKGDLTGVLRDPALTLVQRAMAPSEPDEQLAALRAAVKHAHTLGVTSVQNAGGDVRDLTTLGELRAAGDLKLRVYESLALSPGATDADLDKLDETRKQFGDDPVLKTGAVEIAVDGVMPERLSRLITALDRRGWQVWLRAQTTQAMQWALGAVQAAIDANPSNAGRRRHRLEHADVVTPSDAERAARLGVIASATSAAAAEELAAAHARVVLGSDWPNAALDPRATIQEALAPIGEGFDAAPPRTFSLKNAIDAYTSAAAYASFDDQRKGTLAPGMLADIVVLSGDIFSTPLERLKDARVDVTIFDGAVVFTRGD